MSKKNISNYAKIGLPVLSLFIAGIFYSRAFDAPNLNIWTEQPADVTVCGDAITFTVHVQNVSTDDIDNIKVFPQLPTGMIYVAGTAEYADGTPLVEIDPTGPNPGFSLPNSLSVEVGSDQAVIRFQARADCNIINFIQGGGSNVVTNNTKVEFNLRTEGPTNVREEFEPNGSTSYNILYAAFQYFIASGDNNLGMTSPNQVFNRTLTINNSGTGAVDQVSVYAEFDTSLDYQKLFLQVNGVNTELTPAATTATSVRYDIDLASLGVSFGPNDGLVFTDEVQVASFQPSIETKYYAQWGCDGQVCNAASTEAAFLYITSAGFANVTMTSALLNGNTDLCNGEPLKTSYLVENIGAGNTPEVLDAAFNIELQVYTYQEYDTLVNIYIQPLDANGNDVLGVRYDITNYVTLSTSGPFRFYNINMENSTFDQQLRDYLAATGGFDDLDSDGFFDDLLPGNKVKIIVENTPRLLTEIDLSGQTNDYGRKLTYFSFRYRDWEGDLAIENDNIYTGFRISNQTREIIGDPDFIEGQETIYEFDFRSIYSTGANIYCSEGVYQALFTIPQGYRISSLMVDDQIVSTDLLSINGNENILTYGNDDKINGIRYNIGLMIDNCSATSGLEIENLSWDLYYLCDPACSSGRFKLVQEGREVINHCAECSAFETTGFSMERTTLGWQDDGTNIPIYTYGQLFGTETTVSRVNPTTPGIRLDAVYPYDDIKVTVDGQLNGSGVFNNAQVEIFYESPGEFDLLEFVDGQFIIDGVTYQAPVPSVTQDINNPRLYRYNFELTGIVLNGGNNVDFNGAFRARDESTLPERSAYELTFFGKVYGQNTSGLPVGCFGFGQRMSYLKPELPIEYDVSWPVDCDNTVLIYRGFIYSATSSDDFPNEFRPTSYIDELDLTLPSGFQFDIDQPITAHIFGRNYDLTNTTFSPDRESVTINVFGGMPMVDHKYEILTFEISAVVNKNDLYIPEPNNATKTYPITKIHRLYPYSANPADHMINSRQSVNGIRDRTFNNIILSANSVQEGVGENVIWPIRLCNNTSTNSQTPPGNNWVAVELRSADPSTILEGANDNLGNPLPVIHYGPKDELRPLGKHLLVQVGSLTRGLCKSINVVASYANCQEDLLQALDVYSSYDCNGYPEVALAGGGTHEGSVLDVFNGEQPLNQSEVSIIYKNADLQWTVNKEGPASTDICTPVPFVIDLFSTLYADMTDIELLVELPDNFTSLQSAEFLYPANAGSGASYQPAAYTVLPSGLLRFHITGTDILNGGLPGFQTSQNNIRLRLELNTVCGFDPGLPVRYTVNGTTNCGDPRSFADQRKMPINGVTLDEIDVQLSIVDNNNGTNQVSVTMTNNGTAANSDGEFRIFLDPNVQFGEIVQSDFTGPPTETITTWGKELIWPMPAAFLAVGQTKSIVINTSIPLGSGVSGELVYFARTSMFASANCGPDVCPVNATTGEGNDFIMVPDNAACGAGPDQVICTPSTTMAAANVNGRWTQESGPSQARFSDVTSPLSQVSFGTPGQYRFAWTVVDGSCTPASDDVIIHYNAGFDVTVLPTDRRPVKELTRGRFYGPLGGVDSGLNYPVEGGGAFSGLGIDHKANKVYVNAGDNGIWILDRNTNHGTIISHTTNIPGDNYNQYNPKALLIDETNRVLYAAGQPLGTNAGALWRYDLLTGEGKAFYPSMLLPGGGDPFPNGIGVDIKRFGNELYLSLADPGGSLPGNGLYIYDEAVQSGRLLNSQSTGAGGLYPVQGDPMPADLCLSSTLHSYQGKTYLYVSIMDHGIWEWNITDNIGRMLTPTSTARGGQYAVSGDSSTLLEPYGLRMIGNVLVGSSKANGIWLYDMVTNTGKSLRVNTTAPVGSYASVGDPMPSNNGGGLAYDPITRSLFAGISGATLDQGLTGGHGDGGIWQYNLSTGKSRRHIFGDVGFQMNEYSTFPVVFDRFERAIYGVPTVELPTSGLMAFDLRRGIHACSGEMVTIRANVTGISGVTYQWNENGVPIAGATNATYSTSTPGYYTVTVSQGACVVESQGFIISAPRFDNLVITPGGSTEVCEGGTTLLSVPAGYTHYQWFLDGNPVEDSNINVLTVQANEPGIYTVEASTFEGCQMMASNSVTVSPSSLSLGSTTSFDDLRGRGSIDLAVNGGVSPYTYQWSQGLPAQEDHFNTLLPGAYNVTVTDAVGCTATMNSIIVGLDECPFDLSASITPDNGNGNGAIDITVTGTSGPYTYAWSDGLPSQQDQAGLLAGIYRVVVTDAQGCSEDLFVALGSDCQDVVSYRVLSADVSCYGANDGLIAFSVVDGNPLYGFALYEAATETEVTQDVIKLRFLDNSVLFAGLEPTEYIVSVRQRTCEFFDVFDYNGITIGEPAPLSATFLTQGDNGTGNGSIDLTVTGGTAPYTYNWSGELPATEDPTGVSTEVYSVTVTDARGCELLVEDVYVENANNCSPDHPQRFTMQVVDAVSVACDDGTQQGEITVRLDFANNPPFSGVNYTFRLIRYTDSFNPFRRIGGEIVQEFTGITINTNGFQYTFVNVPMNEEGYAVTVSASGVNPPQHETCLYGTYAFINNAQVDLLPLPDAAFRLNYPLIKVGDAIEATVKDHVKGYSYQYDWNDGTTTTTSFGKSRHRFDTQGNYNITLTVTSDEGCVAQSTQTLRVFDFICESPVPDNGGSFFVDSKTGKIAFRRDECPGNFIFSCVSATAQPNIFDNTVAASATSYSDDWPLAPGDRAAYNFVQGANEFETGERGKWRTKNSYVFKAPLVETGKNYSAGTFQLEDFSWRYEEANNPSKWIRSSTVELYSVHGEAIQERNVLGIASAAKFGYDEALPYLTAQNAEYQDVYFESFERSYGNYLEDNIPARENGVTLTTEVVHAGARSARLDGTFQFNEIRLSDQLVNHGLMLKAWVWTGQPSQLNDLRLVILNTNGTDVSATPVTTVATIGGWTLVEAETHDFGALQVGDLRENSDIMVPALRYTGAGDIWIDDIRVQPSDAQMSAYVYNPANFRLLTVFDDQHFGLYYRYNAEGQLVRKQIETERGVKLIQETQYNTPRVSRVE